MGLFKSKAVKELDNIINDININLSNNYKEPAHKARHRLEARCRELFNENRISEKEFKRYMTVYEQYTVMMKDYHH